MKTTITTKKSSKLNGFSLVEMLVSVVIIAIITAMAVPVLAGAASKAGASKDQRNAQSLAELANHAVAAGDLTIPAAADAEAVVDLLIAGVSGTGAFAGTVFQVQNLDMLERHAAISLLEFTAGTLRLKP